MTYQEERAGVCISSVVFLLSAYGAFFLLSKICHLCAGTSAGFLLKSDNTTHKSTDMGKYEL